MLMLSKVFILFLLIIIISLILEKKFNKEDFLIKWLFRISKNYYKVFIGLIIISLGITGLYNTLKYSKDVSPPNPSDERRVLLSGKVFAENGFFTNTGLPILGEKRGKPVVYTHYPPTPSWLGGVYTEICGYGNLGCFRLFPTAFGIISLILLARFLFTNLNPVKSTIMMLAIAFVPMITNIMHGLDYQSYAFSLLLIQLGFLINIFRGKSRLNIRHLLILFLLGFFQGCFSFDYFFLVILSAFPFALLYSSLNQKEDKKRLILTILALSIGFSFAHFLHFIQVAFYYGSIMEAYRDIVGKGIVRFGASDSIEGVTFDSFGRRYVVIEWASIIDRYRLLKKYLFVYTKKSFFFGLDFKLLLLMTLAFWIKEASLIIQKPFSIVLKWTSSRRYFYVILTGFLVSSLWIIIMYNDGLSHTHLYPTHFFLGYFVCILTVLECISLSTSDNQDR